MLFISRLVTWIGLFLLCVASAHAQGVHVLTVRGAISTASADFLVRGIDKAAEAKARLVVIEMDTPGGLDTSMRDIIKAILASSVPVATYVSPQGARAASAGTYILYASHIAAMAPATNLGAAAPDKPGAPAKKGEKPTDAPAPDAKARKAVNDAAAYIRSLAELRGRNADWAEQAVRAAVSLSAEAALQVKVVDVVATDLADLLQQLHGRKVKLVIGETNGEITLDTAGMSITRLEPDRLKVNAVVYFRVVDPAKSILQVEDFMNATSQLAQTTLRSVLGKHELDQMLAERETLNLDIQQALDAQTDAWGIKVSNVEIKHVDINESMVRAIAKQAEAERERRAKVIHAEGELQASEKLLAAAQILAQQPQAMQLRYLQTLAGIAGDKTNTIVFPVSGEFMDLLARGKNAV